MALGRIVHAQVVADPADDHLAGVEADARREAEAVLALHLGGITRQLVAQVQRRVAGALRVVFVCDRRAIVSYFDKSLLLRMTPTLTLDPSLQVDDTADIWHEVCPLIRSRALPLGRKKGGEQCR